MSTSTTEQHPLSLSILLHLLPGILIMGGFFLLAPLFARWGLPALWALGSADMLLFLPFVFALLYYQGYQRNDRLSLDGVVLYRQPIPLWQYLVLVPIVFLSSALILLFAPVSNLLYERLFSWWLAMYNLSPDWSAYSPSNAMATLLFTFLTVSLIAPIVEEIYFRGYLLPRLSRFGVWAVPLHTILFALFHFWTPWMVVARAIGLIPFTYVAQRKRNIYIGMIAHVLANTLDVVTGLLFILNR